VDLLDCRVMPYAWGSRTAIAAILGRPPSREPEAELWMGAHPVAPSTVDRGGTLCSLEEVVTRAPERELGEAVVRELGPRLPFLIKVLAAAQPLSLQAHPSAAQAREGFDDEERRGVPRDAPARNYKDPSHKPELLCALGPFEALAGFRPVDEALALFDALGSPELQPALEPLRSSPDASGLAATFRALMTMPRDACARAALAVVRASHELGPAFARERELVLHLAQLHPGDVGVVSALLLQRVHLEPGDAIYLGAGGLHAYLEGTGIEIMASSDNVLRGGLTTKHVDVAELLRVLDFGAEAPRPLRPRAVDAHEAVYETPAREFRLSRLVLTHDAAELVREVHGPEILFVAEGGVTANAADGLGDGAGVVVARGCSLFVPASTGRYRLTGSGVVFRATTNLASMAQAK
jgi:mannose-6-phosphate isomerase